MDYYSLISPLLLRLSPERAHNLAIRALSLGLVPRQRIRPHAALAQRLWHMDFAHPVGLAAGFDKNADALHGLADQGFAFVEAGTVTPKPQPGNALPRMFRLTEDQAVINRFGFNNRGIEHFQRQLIARPRQVIIGANIGKNKDSTDAVADYVTCYREVWALCDYVTVNISSPNTQGLRDLQQADALTTLLTTLVETRERCEGVNRVDKHAPILVKIAPDLDQAGLEGIAAAVRASKIDGVIVSNTTLDRPASLQSKHAPETGGLSGAPLFVRATKTLAILHGLLGKEVPLIGVGGIDSPRAAYEKIRAGASLVQLYSALAYQGFGLVKRITEELPALLATDGFAHVRDAVGTGAEEWRKK